MSSFFCEICSYTTNRKNNYTKHLSTQKHIRNLKNFEKKSIRQKTSSFILTDQNANHDFLTLRNFSKLAKFQNPHFEEKKNLENPHNFLTNLNPSNLIKNEKAENFPTFSTLEKPQINKKKVVKKSKLSGKKNSKKEFHCERCNYTTKRSDNFKRHQKTCKKEIKNEVDMTMSIVETTPEIPVSNPNQQLLEARIEHLETQRRAEQEHYRSILAEKERYIDSLKEHNKHISQTHFNIIQNNIITMNPIKFLNTYCTNNPSLKDVVASINEGGLRPDYLHLLDHAIENKNYSIIGEVMNKILQEKNMELIKQTGKLLGTCNNVLFVNDGSGRRYITKGEPGWDYISDDTPLDEATLKVIKKVNDSQDTIDTSNNKYVGKKDRELITKHIKRRNDWNSQKDTIIGNIMGDNLSIEYAIEQEDKKELEAPTSILMIQELEDDGTIKDV